VTSTPSPSPSVCPNEVSVAEAALNEKLSDIHADLSPALKLLADKHYRRLVHLNLKNQRKLQKVHSTPLVKKRNRYSAKQREIVTKYFNALPGKYAMRLFTINGISGYEKITHNSIQRWKQSNKKVPGRKVSGEFERQIAAELLIFNLNASENDMTDQVEILANSIYSYECVQSAASGCLMWIELQLKAFKVSFINHPDVIFLSEKFFATSKVLLVLDNCGPHKTAAVRQAFDTAGWKVMFFSPKHDSPLATYGLMRRLNQP
jgi:hypothetical protein